MIPKSGPILDRLRAKGSRVMTFAQLSAVFGVEEPERDEFRGLLDRMEREGAVARVRGEKYSAIEHSGFVAGRISVRAEGYGFVLSPDRAGSDLYVPARGMRGALDGDVVLAREEAPRKPAKGRRPDTRLSGSVVRVIERKRDRIVGQFQDDEGRLRVVPHDPRMATEVRIAADGRGGARNREIVVVRFTSFPDDQRVSRGEVVECLGFLGEPGVDVEIVMRLFDLPNRFPREVEAEAATFPGEVRSADTAGREDYRERLIVTIDGETARDFDDAVEVEKTDRGFRLGVHIADVSHYVTEASALDSEARFRGTSVYFPGRVVPMLPEHLSNGLCSLNPRVDRLTLSAIIDFDRNGRVRETHFAKSVIRSAARMTYTEVARLLERPVQADGAQYGGLLDAFGRMRELALLLRGRREERGAIDFDLPSASVTLDDDGYVIGIRPESRNIAHSIIEEFMLAANEAVARYLLFAKEPSVYRVHDRPDPDRLVDLRETLESFDYELKGDLALVPPQQFQRILREVKGKPEERFLTELLLRSQQKAIYSPECRGHYALAAEYYCHFTSPIRRYPDLLVHRALSRRLSAARPFPPEDVELRSAALQELAKESSERERRAESAERESLLWKKIVFLKDKVGRVFDAYVSGVAAFGLFVLLSEFQIEGLVPVSTMADDFYIYEDKQHRLRGRSSGRVFRLGDVIRVKLAGIDEFERKINFRIEGSEPVPARRGGGR